VVERSQVNLEAMSEFGCTTLQWAAHKGHLPVVQYLCGQGVDMETRSLSGMTPLHLATHHESKLEADYLIGCGAVLDRVEVAMSTTARCTPHSAAHEGHILKMCTQCEKNISNGMP